LIWHKVFLLLGACSLEKGKPVIALLKIIVGSIEIDKVFCESGI
jgi:hypothetical protein